MIAYKGFDKDLTCTSGGNRFQYKLDEWNEEPEANCRQNGFHCAENPLDCLTYYPNWNAAVYYLVLIDGDINEDGIDSKISCTKMKLVEELSLDRYVAHALKYIVEHPFRENSNNVSTDMAEVRVNNFAIARGKNPLVKGKIGDILGFVQEELEGSNITEIGMYIVDGNEIMPDTWYDIQGNIDSLEGDNQ